MTVRHGSIPKALGAILAAFFVLGLIYAWATPVLEASDELWHFGLVAHLAAGGELPVQDPDVPTPWEQEGSQPPLYYGLAAGVTRLFDLGDLEDLRQPNPHAKAGIPLDSDNKNLVLHATPHAPLTGSAAAVYAIRLCGILLGLITIGAVYGTARELAPERPGIALLAAGLTAFNPMFVFIAASVNNDNLVIALGSVVTWQMLVMLREGLTWQRSLLLAVLLALASLTKLSGNVLIPVVALAGLGAALPRRDWRGLALLAGAMAAAWLLIAGWWYGRNLQLYGELFGTQMMVAVAGPRLEAFSLGTLLAEFQGFRISYWGLFGGVNVLTFEAFYVLMDALTIVAVLGLAYALWRAGRALRGRAGLLALIVLLGLTGVIAWTAQTYASQGRLLFPYLAAISSLLALGLAAIPRGLAALRLPPRLVSWLGAGLVIGLGLIALLIPFGSIAPAYAQPPTLAGLPADASPIDATFGDGGPDGSVTLIGYRVADQRYEPGDSVPITVYWRVNQPAGRDLSLYLHAVDDQGNVLGKIDTYPGAGSLRTTTWQAGAIYADTYAVPLDSAGDGARSGLRISVGWWHRPSNSLITPVAQDGAPLQSVMLGAGGFVNPEAGVELPEGLEPVSNAGFGGVLTLTGYRLEDDMLTLAWEATGTPPDNYTVFVQVLDSANTIVGQGDAPPALPTRYWRRGERYVTVHPIAYPEAPPAGEYAVLVGWYRPADFARLSTDRPDSAYLVATTHLP